MKLSIIKEFIKKYGSIRSARTFSTITHLFETCDLISCEWRNYKRDFAWMDPPKRADASAYDKVSVEYELSKGTIIATLTTYSYSYSSGFNDPQCEFKFKITKVFRDLETSFNADLLAVAEQRIADDEEKALKAKIAAYQDTILKELKDDNIPK